MLVIGLTGGLGTGKSTVARMFAELGATVLDADAIAHELLEPGQPGWSCVVDLFGAEILQADQRIDRKKLADRVFADSDARRKLEAVVHPLIRQRMQRELGRLAGEGRAAAVVCDVPLLLETHAQSMVEAVVVVTAPPDVARARLAERGWTEEEFAKRAAAQWDLSRKSAMADAVVDNGNGLEQTRRQVEQLWNRLRAVKQHA